MGLTIADARGGLVQRLMKDHKKGLQKQGSRAVLSAFFFLGGGRKPKLCAGHPVQDAKARGGTSPIPSLFRPSLSPSSRQTCNENIWALLSLRGLLWPCMGLNEEYPL